MHAAFLAATSVTGVMSAPASKQDPDTTTTATTAAADTTATTTTAQKTQDPKQITSSSDTATGIILLHIMSKTFDLKTGPPKLDAEITRSRDSFSSGQFIQTHTTP